MYIYAEPAPMHKVFAEPEVAVAAEQEDAAEEKEQHATGQFEPATIAEQSQNEAYQFRSRAISARATTSRNPSVSSFFNSY